MENKNNHLLPQIVLDLVAKINTKPINQNEYFSYQLRLETIIKYCQEGLTQAEKNSIFGGKKR
jgi:hypothetical protein